MFRFALLAVLGACAHGVSEPNPPSPPPPMSVPYAGRIVLATDALRDRVDEFSTAWTRRLQILGLTAKVTYDDDRAVIDVYGAAAAQLERVAKVLADPGGYRLDGYAFDGIVETWLPSTPACNCSGRVRLSLDSSLLCALSNGDQTVERNGVLARMQGTIFWAYKDSDRYYAYPPEPGACRGDTWWPDNMVLELPIGASSATNVDIVLALGGGSLPAIPRIASITGGAS